LKKIIRDINTTTEKRGAFRYQRGGLNRDENIVQKKKTESSIVGVSYWKTGEPIIGVLADDDVKKI